MSHGRIFKVPLSCQISEFFKARLTVFHLVTVVRGLNIALQAGIKMTEQKIDIFNSIFRPLPKLKMFLKAYSESSFLGDLQMV